MNCGKDENLTFHIYILLDVNSFILNSRTTLKRTTQYVLDHEKQDNIGNVVLCSKKMGTTFHNKRMEQTFLNPHGMKIKKKRGTY
ncbi:hypothetical protein CR513_03600, partial [Mucuna pruriens]